MLICLSAVREKLTQGCEEDALQAFILSLTHHDPNYGHYMQLMLKTEFLLLPLFWEYRKLNILILFSSRLIDH